MMLRCTIIGIRPICLLAAAGILPTLTACSSSEDARPTPMNDAGNEGGIAARDGGNSGNDAGPADGDAGKPPAPPPYDFAVRCTGVSCATQIAARGGTHACVIMQDGSVRCWGSNAFGQLGTGTSDAGPIPAYEGTPRPVLGLSNATSIAASGDGVAGTTCVVSDAGAVACFGSDAWGQLGRAGTNPQSPNPDPLPVEALQAKSVTLTNTFALAIGTDDRLWSWGTNDTRQLARTTSGPDAGSASVAAHADSVVDTVRACAGTSKTGFVVSAAGELLSWGGGTFDQLGRPSSLERDPVPFPIAMSDVSSVTTGSAHACALHDGSVYCWGKNDHGQLGTGRRAEELLPTPAVLPTGVYAVALTAGGNDTCVITADGTLYCWGANGSGQLGASAPVDQASPVKIESLGEEVVGVAVMDASICALLRGGSVACLGDNLLGQLGRRTRDAERHPAIAPVVFE
jgi:alpha-tubulin suppressor-like RCC1 family protein